MDARHMRAWLVEIGRVRATREVIAACVAESPRKARWLARTDAALALLVAHYRRRGGTQE